MDSGGTLAGADQSGAPGTNSVLSSTDTIEIFPTFNPKCKKTQTFREKIKSWLLYNALGERILSSRQQMRLFPLRFVSQDWETAYLQWRWKQQQRKEMLGFSLSLGGLALLVLAVFWSFYYAGSQKLDLSYMQLDSKFLNISMSITVVAAVFWFIFEGKGLVGIEIPENYRSWGEVFASAMLFLIVLGPCLWILCTSAINSTLAQASEQLLLPTSTLNLPDAHNSTILTIGHRAGSLLVSTVLTLVLFLAVCSRSIRCSFLMPLFGLLWSMYLITITIGYICVRKANPIVQAVNQFLIYAVVAQFFAITSCIVFLSWISVVWEVKDREYFIRSTYHSMDKDDIKQLENVSFPIDRKVKGGPRTNRSPPIRSRVVRSVQNTSKKLQRLAVPNRRKKQKAMIEALNRTLVLVKDVHNTIDSDNKRWGFADDKNKRWGTGDVDNKLTEVAQIIKDLLCELGSEATRSIWFDNYATEARRFIERAMVPVYDGQSAILTLNSQQKKRKLHAAIAAAAAAAVATPRSPIEDSCYAECRKLLPSVLHIAGHVDSHGEAILMLEQNVGRNLHYDLSVLIGWIPDILQATGVTILRDFFDSAGCKKLERLLSGIEDTYNPNPYHNWLHGAMVGHMFCSLLNDLECLRNSPFFSADDYCIAIIAALGHDVGHRGRTNVFYTETCDPVSFIWCQRSILEMFHTCTLTKMLGECGIIEEWDLKRQTRARAKLYDLILATDMAEHFNYISRAESLVGTGGCPCVTDGWTEDDTWLILKCLFKLADLGHGLLYWDSHYQWSLRIAEEFYQQGDEEISLGLPVSQLCARSLHRTEFARGQTSFLRYVVLPCVSLMCSLPGTHENVNRCAYSVLHNAEIWVSLVDKTAEDYLDFRERWARDLPARHHYLRTRFQSEQLTWKQPLVDENVYNIEIPEKYAKLRTNISGTLFEGVLRLLN